MKLTVSFVELHNPLFMQGTNLGNKIKADQRHADMEFDTETKLLTIEFKDKLSIVPDSNIVSMDLLDPTQYFGTDKPKRGRPVKAEPVKTPNIVQDNLIVKAQADAAALKTGAQVSNPTRPTVGATGVQGAPKYMSHEQLAAKVAAENKK